MKGVFMYEGRFMHMKGGGEILRQKSLESHT